MPTDPLRADTAAWTCLTCHSSSSAEDVVTVIADASTHLSTLDKSNLNDCKKYIKEFEKKFHHHHYLLTDVKLAITQILDAGVGNLAEDDLMLKLQYCRQLNKLITKLVPAENRCRGVLLFGLHAALAEIGRRKSNRREIDPADLKNNLLVSIYPSLSKYFINHLESPLKFAEDGNFQPEVKFIRNYTALS